MAKINRTKHSRKMRGQVSHGHGRVGKARKHPSGRGNAGGLHHHRIWFDRFHPGYFGKVGMRQFIISATHRSQPAINVNKLWSLVGEEALEQAKSSKKAIVIDTVERGYDKVIGSGNIPNIPMVVRARFFSKSAETKIRAAGGICQLRA